MWLHAVVNLDLYLCLSYASNNTSRIRATFKSLLQLLSTSKQVCYVVNTAVPSFLSYSHVGRVLKVMKQCSKSTWLAVLTVFSLFVLLVLVNYDSDGSDEFLTFLDEDPLASAQELWFSNKIIDLNVTHRLKPSTCNASLYIMLITSYYGNVETRASIRRTFRDLNIHESTVKLVFLLGTVPKDVYTTQKSIENEHKRFGDILQGDFVESYKNLTYKHLMGLKYVFTSCKSRYVIKIDDDIVINVRAVLNFLNDPNLKLPKALLAGYVLKEMPVIRLHQNKWYVSENEFKDSIYPNFLSGWFYITNSYTIEYLLRVSNTFKYFWIDDAFITGIFARKLGIRHYDLREKFIVDPRHTLCCYRDLIEANTDCEFFAAPNGGDNNLFYKMNANLEKCQINECAKRKELLNKTCNIDVDKINYINGKPLIEEFKLI